MDDYNYDYNPDMDLWTVEEELDMTSFHAEDNGFNYATVPGERWGVSKIFLHQGRGFTKDRVSPDNLRLYLRCRKQHYQHNPCKARAVIYSELPITNTFFVFKWRLLKLWEIDNN